MIGILKYRAGNLASVSNALERLGADYLISDQPEELERCAGVIFPGVGHAAAAMQDLRKRGLDRWLQQTDKPVLGICLGMQLLYEETEEGDSQTLGLLPGRLRKFDPAEGKVPHMGWNLLQRVKNHPILSGIEDESFYYFVHSYYAPVNHATVASCNYGRNFAAIAARDNYTGVQFHPEKSAGAGKKLLRNYLEIVLNRTQTTETE